MFVPFLYSHNKVTYFVLTLSGKDVNVRVDKLAGDETERIKCMHPKLATPKPKVKLNIYHISLNQLQGYSSCQSHFSEINAKLAEENEFVTHFVRKCLETRENEQNVVLNESSEALGNRSEIVRILVLAMTTADNGVGGSNSV